MSAAHCPPMAAAGMPPAHGADDLAQFRARLARLRAELGPPTQPGAYEASTDGACLGNPDGPGGWAALVGRPGGGASGPWELWGHLTSTSNNRAEALGLLAALEWVPRGSALLIRSDSELTVKLLAGTYKAKANTDLWREIRRVVADKQLAVQPRWVRGHAGDPANERADALAVLGATNGNLERWERLRATARRVPRVPTTPPELAGLAPRGAWESAFLQSVARQLRAGRPLSDKQQAVLARIRARGAADGELGAPSA